MQLYLREINNANTHKKIYWLQLIMYCVENIRIINSDDVISAML